MQKERVVTRGLVLRVTESKEADYILTVLTAELGRITVVARGARRRTSKVSAVTQLLAFSEMTLYERNGFLMLSEGATIELFGALRCDVELLSLGAYFAQMVEEVSAEGVDAAPILSLILNALYALDTLKKPPQTVKAAFELRLLSLSGYEPLLDDCAVCGEHEPTEPVFDVVQGVVCCRKCAGHGDSLLALDGASLAAMRHIVLAPGKKLLAFSIDESSEKRLAAVCERFAAVQLDRNFKTLDFYKSIRLT